MKNIPIAHPVLGEEEVDAVSGVLRSGMFASGPVVKAFEKKFAEWCGVDHAIATSNGTTALHATLSCSGIGPGDEVIVPAFSFIATATSVSMCGARPVFADVRSDTFSISPESIQELVSPKTKAVIGVHLYGQPCEVREIQEICQDNNLHFIEDAAQAHGARYREKPVGSLGLAGCFSFYPTKNMTTGEGGMVTTNDSILAEKIRVFINHGQSQKYLHTTLGYNYRMTDIHAAIGLAQMQKIDGYNKKRNENAHELSRTIAVPGLVLPICRPDRTHVYHQYVIRITSSYSRSRTSFIQEMEQKGIGTAIHYPIPIHRQPVYAAGYRVVSCPVSEALAEEVVSLPVHPSLTNEDITTICRAVQERS